jgi:hypothetical protein
MFREQPELAKVQYRMEVIGADGSPTGVLKPPSHVPVPHGDVALDELAMPFDLMWMPTSGNAFPAWVLRRLMPIPPTEFFSCADWYLQHLPPLLGPVASCEWVGACYRVHGRNSYERGDDRLSLDQVRAAVRYAAATKPHLLRVAQEVDLRPVPTEILSVADLANRMTSRKLDPAHHPVAGDTTLRLMAMGLGASWRRPHTAPLMRLLFCGWFVGMVVSPRSVARRLSRLFHVPERRPRFNRVASRLHRRRRP